MYSCVRIAGRDEMKILTLVLLGIFLFLLALSLNNPFWDSVETISEQTTKQDSVVFEGEQGLELREPDYSGCMREVGNTWVCNELFNQAVAKEEGLVSFEYALEHHQKYECIGGTAYDSQGREFYPHTSCMPIQFLQGKR